MSVHGCRGVVPLAAGSAQLAAFVGREMLRGAFAAIASSGIAARADLLHLARDILSRQLPLPPEPREVGIFRFSNCRNPVHKRVIHPDEQVHLPRAASKRSQGLSGR